MTTDKHDPSKYKKAVAVQKTEHSTPARVTAKGSGILAERILDIAFEKDIKVRQDKELTEILHELDIESPVPLEALSAISQILEYIYRANLSSNNLGNNDQVDLSKAAQQKASEKMSGQDEVNLASPIIDVKPS